MSGVKGENNDVDAMLFLPCRYSKEEEEEEQEEEEKEEEEEEQEATFLIRRWLKVTPVLGTSL